MVRVWAWWIPWSAVVALASTPPGSIDAFVAEALPASGAPGIAFAVVDHGAVEAGAQGEILQGSGRALTPDTPFRIGSISKSFTAVLVMQLVEAGQVGLDDAIARHLSAFSDSPGAAITLRQLLSHTSGYATLQGNDRHVDPPGSEDALARQVDRIASWEPAYAPGTRWAYSNANYLVLGALVQEVTGLDYATCVTSRILEPLGMTHSFVADGGVHEGMAVGHVPWFGRRRALDDARTHRVIAPSGGVIASARDTARYLAVMMNGEDDILRAGSKARMMRPASDVAPHYGLGWAIDPAEGTVSHTGVVPGIDTLAVMIPAEQRGVVVLVNGAGGLGFGETAGLFDGVRARALGLEPVGTGGRWGRMALSGGWFLSPWLFLAGVAWAGTHRAAIRAKTGLSGAFSLWFPLLMTLVLAWVSVHLVPRLFGVSLATLHRFQPDLALAMVATAVTGVVWSLVRLGVHHSGRRGASASEGDAIG
ncbi:MAG: beta-lactamase family protein [Alphaproteobacteria bacterium]|nr:beta-lactamase family protein [Alphaproteobacteria bacterium]